MKNSDDKTKRQLKWERLKARETPEQREIRLKKSRDAQRRWYKKQTEDTKEQIRVDAKLRYKEWRENASESELDDYRKRRREYAKTRRQNETPHEREQRLKRHRVIDQKYRDKIKSSAHKKKFVDLITLFGRQ